MEKMMAEDKKGLNVYQCINKVQEELAKAGISKDKTASTGGNGTYKFRGIDDIYNALSTIMAKHGLCILPRYSNKQVVERTSSKGNALFYTTVDGEFDFVSSHDGSKHPVTIIGEAMDSGDKGTNKAMSAAYKYACLQAFCIPTEAESVDSESDTHEVKPEPKKPNASDNKKKYQEYIDCLTKTTTKELWDKVKPKKDAWVLWATKQYSEEYGDQLNDKFLELAKKFEPVNLGASIEDQDLPDFLK